MPRLLRLAGSVVAALVTGCGEPDCSFDHVVAEYAEGLQLHDCGDLPPWDLLTTPIPDPAAARAAHDCAVASWSAQLPFVVHWRIPHIEGTEEIAFVAHSVAGEWSLASFVNGVSVNASASPTVKYGCSDLVDRGDCADVTRTLCLDCADRELVERCGD